MLKLIMEYGTVLDINHRSKEGLYPLLLTINKNNIEITELILDYANENEIKLIINEKDKENIYSFMIDKKIKKFKIEDVIFEKSIFYKKKLKL